MAKAIDLTGQKFGRLTVVERLFERKNYSATFWLCTCECGKTDLRIRADYLKKGITTSCGCYRTENNAAVQTKHGLSRSDEYRIWRGMLDRCYNPNAENYPVYGGSGVAVCDEWKESFETFYRDMGHRPSSVHSIDRKNNELGYSKENCRWATKIEQANNTRKNVFYSLNGVSRTLAAWCRELGINYVSVHSRLRLGMSFEEAIKVKSRT